jgi:uncharacterized membrane protein
MSATPATWVLSKLVYFNPFDGDLLVGAVDITAIISRIVHVLTAIALLGGAFYVRTALLPAARDLSETEHDALKSRLRSRWSKVVMIGILLLIVTGFYNYLVVAAPAVKGQKLYHPLMGVKILLAFAVFFLASALAGRSAAFESLRRQPARWLTLLLVLGGLVVAIGSVLKVVVPRTPPAAAATTDTASE